MRYVRCRGEAVLVLSALVFAGCSAGIPEAAQAKPGKSEGADLVFGGTGTAPGEFTNIRDLTLDAAGNIYVLEAGGKAKDSKGEYTGLARVQKFDATGKPLAQFALGDDLDPEKDQPRHLAADGTGNVYVAFPTKDIVRQYGPDGTKIRDHAVPGATSVAYDAQAGRIAALAGYWAIIKGKWDTLDGGHVWLLDPAGGRPQSVSLARPIKNAADLAVDAGGDFYALDAASNQIFAFDPAGKLTRSIGSGTVTRAEDGSEPMHAVAVDSKGNIYSFTWGNPGHLLFYSADGKRVRTREGQFKWADTWSSFGQYLPLAIGPDDRLWVASTNLINHPLYDKFHFRPAIIRAEANFFDPTVRGVTDRSALGLGLKPSLQSKLTANVAFDLVPIHSEFVVAASNRNVKSVTVDYRVFDVEKKEITKGTVPVPLQDGVEARAPLEFTPPRYGWYDIEANVSGGGENLGGVSQHFMVTPRYANMPATPEEFVGGWEDAARQAFCGLPEIRLHGGKGLDKLDKDLQAARRYNATVFVQLTDNKNEFSVEKVQPLVERFKGRIAYYELFNEPNFSFSPADYAAKAKPIYDMIKRIDPAAQVMGPAVCGVQLPWIEAFYKAGGKDTCDILSVHDYEGHESISPEHWRWKFGALHDLMAQYGDGDKPVWQTERAISSVRGALFTGGAQAVRTTLQRDLLQTLGIPPEHNSHYYLNQGGYSSVSSYIWSAEGPYPAALALRTRHALTNGRKYLGTVDFGPQGNEVLLGLRYGGDGNIVVLRNLGTTPIPVEASVTGGGQLAVIDSCGNATTVPVRGGKATVTTTQLPVYLKLAPGQDISFSKINFGPNLAAGAVLTYSGKGEGDLALLTNGVLETMHAGNPNGDTNGAKIWKGDALDPAVPQTLEMKWEAPRTFDTVFLRGIRADNAFCALLDYDLQVWQNGAWKDIAQVRSAAPASDEVASADATVTTWLQDDNFWLNRFAPVTTDRLRLVFKRTTFGFAPDETAAAAVRRAWGGVSPARPMLREIEIYSRK